MKLYKKPGDSKGAQPFALIEDNGSLTSLNEEQRIETFPNDGRVFIQPNYDFQNQEVFRIYELVPFATYDETRPGSMKYKLGFEMTDIKLYEVIDIDFSIDENSSEIAKLLRNGIKIKQHITMPVLLRTLDDLLIGPITLKYEDGLYFSKNSKSKFYSYFLNEADIVTIYDTFREQERLFTISKLLKSNFLGWLDVATDEEVFETTLVQLDKYNQYGHQMQELLQKFNGILNTEQLLDEQLEMRLMRAISLISKEMKYAPLLEQLSGKFEQLRVEHETVVTKMEVDQCQRNYNYSEVLQQSSEVVINELKQIQHQFNLNLKTEKNVSNQLAMLIYTAALINEPVILYGHQSFDLSHIIAKTIACEETISYVPEIEAFSLTNLQQQFERYHNPDCVKALLVHEITTTTAQFSLPTFIKQLKWLANENSPDLIILTVANKEEASLLQQKFLSAIIINADDYVPYMMTKHNIKALTKSQLMLTEFDYIHSEISSNYLQREFSKQFSINLPQEIVLWLFYFKELSDSDTDFKNIITTCFPQYFQQVNKND